MTSEMEIVSICQDTGWTYFEYIDQPEWFLELLRVKLQMDNNRRKKEFMRSKRK